MLTLEGRVVSYTQLFKAFKAIVGTPLKFEECTFFLSAMVDVCIIDWKIHFFTTLNLGYKSFDFCHFEK